MLLEVPERVLERLMARWQHYDLPPEEIAAKVNENDLPNGRYVIAESGGEDYRQRADERFPPDIFLLNSVFRRPSSD